MRNPRSCWNLDESGPQKPLNLGPAGPASDPCAGGRTESVEVRAALLHEPDEVSFSDLIAGANQLTQDRVSAQTGPEESFPTVRQLKPGLDEVLELSKLHLVPYQDRAHEAVVLDDALLVVTFRPVDEQDLLISLLVRGR